MKFEEKLKKKRSEDIWNEYCGFLDLNISEYMRIQKRLMEEQLFLWEKSELGKKLLQGRRIHSIDELREKFPLTTYEDYADVLLQKKGGMLPDDPIIWIQTTWEGGKHPIKVAPYTQSMLNTYKNNVLACMILSTSTEKKKFDVKATDTFLYGLAPLPYATGLFPRALHDEISIEFLPPVEEAEGMSFSERNKRGFKLAMSKGIDYFFGLGSVAYFVSQTLSKMGGGGSGKKGSSIVTLSPKFLLRYLKAKRTCKKEGRDLIPRDLFDLKGFMVAGTDNHCYKDELEELWGVRPMELFAGTEPSCIGTETWTREGMYFFPDTCFYEFIPEAEMNKNLEDKTYQPKTYLMDEVQPGEKYEIVISVLKGGAFMRYRVGDVYRCMGLENSEDQTKIPRFKYIDRVSNVIDIAGFTRITESAVQTVVDLSGLDIEDWFAAKEYNENKKPFMHVYVELAPDSLASQAVGKEILKEHLTVYFKYVDHDYKDLKMILGMDPLQITILKCGTFAEYERRHQKKLRKVNPSVYEIKDLLELQKSIYAVRKEGTRIE
ncbi:GH3 auxin-responsive promoter family protein [Anaerovorax odorimutans]|uniref:GH3 auxin-responsive promoter family protein n=1 Tax=Anaerovorax odorimutans TaxID=109327 RepID=A0ABT1RS20_9FIRM|nr:GH3 auxin-responsive promoter family protein [Anaerovorax odorimutans]MCQ4637962.1 GH3 auxin-responsive promoter family protein [Anaerovorax odorimutans]